MSVQGARVLTLVLAATCGALLLLAILLQVGVGRGYSWLSSEDDAVSPLGGGAVDRQPFKLPAESSFAETTTRPIFNEDRKPTPETPEAPVAAQPSAPLNISLTGIILTPQLHLAMIHDNAKNDPFSVKEGMPLPGDLGGWTLTKVKERSAMFKEAAGDEVEVELTTAVAGPKPGTPPPRPTGAAPVTPATAQAPQFGPKPPAPANKPPDSAQAEQMQRRIEERRKQMRDEAERLKQQQSPQH
jgi:general secretion pathway protein N